MTSVSFPEPNCQHLSSSEEKKSSPPFIGRMRFHQSWYRRTVLGLGPGPNPHARNAIYGNMLKAEDGSKGRNFLTPEIFEHAQHRFPLSRNDSDTNRLYRNLLSSQPMCFNLLGPLNSDEVATRLMRRLPGFPGDAQVTGVLFEYAPPKENHLDDLTAFDAFVTYERANGTKGFIGIETKLTEPFSQAKYEFADRYARWRERGQWWWKSGAEVHFMNKSFNQLWRNHLLVYSMLNQKSPEYSEGYCAIVYPHGDSECGDAIDQYRNLLVPPGDETLLSWPLESIARLWAPTMESDALREWFDSFQKRYLWLEESEDVWQEFLRK